MNGFYRRFLDAPALALLGLVSLGGPEGTAATAEPWTVHVWAEPFDYTSTATVTEYQPLDRASRPWRLCVCYPHLKDSYWLSVNYGMVQEVERLDVGMELFTAGGYPNLERQKEQIRRCAASDADALIVGAVSYDGLTQTILEASGDLPVVAAVNDIADEGIDAKVGVSWHDLGATASAYLAERHPAGTSPVDVARFPGPRDSGWVSFIQSGFESGLAASSARVVTTKRGDTGAEIQHLLLEEALEEYPDIDYIVGSAPTAEAAVGLLRARDRLGEIGVIADYFTHGVFRGIKRERILAAPNDSPVLQGRLAIDMAVRLLEGELHIKHAGPPITIVTAETVDAIDLEQSLSPAEFAPTFRVEPATRAGTASAEGSASAP
ncbi:MAG: TMAO reductase system periplasmic protein TorT [Halofilum sp. (in: g-proteobacteria)]